MIKMLDEFIYDRISGICVTFNKPSKQSDYEEIVDVALEVIYAKKIIDSKNIKSFYINDFSLIFCKQDGLYYIQKIPDRGKTKSIM